MQLAAKFQFTGEDRHRGESSFEPVRVCILEVGDNPRYPYKPHIPLTVLVNPVVVPEGDERFDDYEGCLSVPNLRGKVSRSARVHVTGWDRHGAALDLRAAGITAGTYQHEVDHLDGMLFVDRVKDTKTLTTWADFERYHQQAFVAYAKEIATYGS